MLCPALLALVACLTPPPQPTPTDGAKPAPPVDPQSLPWPARLGLRVAMVELAVPVAKQVVLVPDAATWLDEVGHWSATARWPVLIEDDVLAPLFIRGFKPERVLRRPSVGTLPADKGEREKLLAATAARAWRDPKAPADAPTPSLDDALKAAGLVPPAVVVTSVDDPAWPAAVALAAGRGLPIRFVDGDFGAPNDVLDAARFHQLDQAVRGALDSTGLPYASLGDAVDAIALCRTVAAKATPDLPPQARVTLPANAPIKATDPLAVADCLGRDGDGKRYAVVGWIPGPSPRAAYMAMASLFLPRDDWWFISGYATSEPWSRYAPEPAAALLKNEGYQTRTSTDAQASLANWLRLLMGGFSADIIVMNSSGDPNWFSLTGNDRGRTQDVPFLATPAALHLIHSWSLTRPTDAGSIGARLLDRGVYAYVGSVQEPLLMAFVPPQTLARRVASLGPFLVSSRWLEGNLDVPWRVTAIGDPLMLVLSPSQKKDRHVAGLPEARGADVRGEAMQRMKAFAQSGGAEDLKLAMADLVAIGEDELAAGLWRAAEGKGGAAAVARQALPALFRTRSFDEFMRAFKSIPQPTSDEVDMLWHLATPRVASLDIDTLGYLRRHLRKPDIAIDLGRLLPGIDAAAGRRASDRIVQEEMDLSADQSLRSRLSELLRR